MQKKPSETMPESLQQRVLTTLTYLPPVEAYLSTTPEQAAQLQAVKEHFQDIQIGLSAYFGGRKNPVGQNDPKRKKLIEQEIQYYLRCYDLFWYGWAEIESEVARSLPGQSFPESPGDALLLLLQLDCGAMVAPILQGATVNVWESKKLLAAGIPNPDEFAGTEKKRALRSISYGNEVLERSGTGAFLTFCQDAVKKRLRGNPTLKGVLTEFTKLQRQRFSQMKRLLNGVTRSAA